MHGPLNVVAEKREILLISGRLATGCNDRFIEMNLAAESCINARTDMCCDVQRLDGRETAATALSGWGRETFDVKEYREMLQRSHR